MVWSPLATQIVVGIVTAIIIGFDIWLASNGVPGDTISVVIHKWAILAPFIPYVWGVLTGHFFLPMHSPVFREPWASIVLGSSGIIMILLGILLRYFAITAPPLFFVFVGICAGHYFFPL